MDLPGFRALAKEVDRSLDFVLHTLEGRPRFWVLAKNGKIIHRLRSDGRRPSKPDQLLRIEREETKLKVSALLRNMEPWKRRIESLLDPGFEVKTRTTPGHMGRTTFTGYPGAFDQHRPFLIRLIRATTQYDKPQ